jgi:2-succinyl-5-enolpyruvyl-6-hydroxy-3-cyclohexene-1-carboxylate synthase
MITTSFTHIAEMAECLVQNNITNVVLSPGSRNAPLIIAFDSHPKIKTYVVHDERSAAFFALGLIDELQKGVAIVCTSGSAPLNYSPAIAEAYYRQLPLLVLTADRPDYLIDQGDGQCIRQNNVYNNFIKYACQLDEKTSEYQLNIALNNLLTSPEGPVHINVPLEEPLYQLKDINLSKNYQINFKSSNQLEENDKQELSKIWHSSDKKLIIIGQLHPNHRLQQLLGTLAQNPSVAVLVENTSNIQFFNKFCHSIDRVLTLITEDEIEQFKPDLLISIGGAIISKKIKTFFRKNKPKHNWKVGEFIIDADTFQSKTKNINVLPAHFITFINTLPNQSNTNYGNLWKSKDFISQQKHEDFIEEAPYCDLKVFDFILDTLPDNCSLQMANSSVVRYCQLFNPVSTITYFSNRGVSGIDGSTSTALGMAVANPEKLTVLITGDLSFFYDSNALWNQYLPTNFRIILINNNGGSIFEIIDGPKSTKQKNIFVAPHSAKAKDLCKAFNVEYFNCQSIESIENIIYEFYQTDNDLKTKLLEINTSNCPNAETLKAYFSFIKN